MTVHSLTKSAIFFAVGHAAQKAGSQLMDDIRGLITLNPTIGWGLMLGTLAILGHAAVRRVRQRIPDPDHRDAQQPWATPILLMALGVAFAAIFGRVQSMVFGETTARSACRTSPRCCRCSRTWRSCWCSACTFRRTWPTGTARRRG